jgi:hypothetical protein
MLKLLDCEFTITDNAIDEVADGDNSNQPSIINHWEMPHALSVHRAMHTSTE